MTTPNDPESSDPRSIEPRVPRSRAQHLTMWGVSLLVVAILASLLVPAFRGFIFKGRMTENLGRGRQLYLAMRAYASEIQHGKRYPTFLDDENGVGLFQTSNEALQVLVPRYLDDKRPIYNAQSAWCTERRSDPHTNNILPGENDWCYMRGLTDNSNSRWPILANAFVPGTTHYVADRSKPGGVWKGTRAVVIWSGGSAEIAATEQRGATYFIPRADDASSDAFVPDGDWLSGENIQLLYPELPANERR